MRWIPLELAKVADIEKQVGEVIRTYDTLTKQIASPRRGVNVAQVNQALRVLKAAMVTRVVALEVFYRENDLDARAARFEASRLKLKRALKEAGMTPQEFAAIAAQSQQPSPAQTGSSPATPAAAAATPRGPRSGGGNTITLRVHMTPAEFEELRARRQAITTVRRGQGQLAWEAAARNPRADPAAQGMFTYHEVPFDDRPSPRRGDGPGMRFDLDSYTPREHASGLHQGPYTSNHPEVFAKTARFQSAADAWRGGDRAVDPARPFNAVASRTNVSNSVAKMRPLGA